MIVAMQGRIVLFLSALLLALPSSVRADDCVPLLESGWIRQPPMAMPMMAGFAQIRNPCAAPVTVVSASSPSFGSVELHETTRVDGVSRMRHVDRLEVPAGGTVALAPGGLTYQHGLELLTGLQERGRLIGLGFAEFYPDRDVNGLTAFGIVRLAVAAMATAR